jgi:hypothetical protein
MKNFKELQSKMLPERQARNGAAAERMLAELPSQPKGCIVDTTEANRGNAYQFLAARRPTPKK